MSLVHIYTAKIQPATNWTDNNGLQPFTVQWSANRLLWCLCCDKRRPAKNCVVQSFYDTLYIWCASDKGCKHPKIIVAKRRLEFRNRSAGQRARWARLALDTETEGA